MDVQVCLLFSVSSNTVCICKNRSFQASFLSLESLRCPFAYTNLSDCFPWNRFSTASASNTAATVASTSDPNPPQMRSLTLTPHPPMRLWSRTSVPAARTASARTDQGSAHVTKMDDERHHDHLRREERMVTAEAGRPDIHRARNASGYLPAELAVKSG